MSNPTPKCLFEGTQLGTALSTLYISIGIFTLVDKLSLVNTSAAGVTVDVHIVPNGGSATAANKILDAVTIASHTSYLCPEMVGQILGPGDFIQASASAVSSVSARGSGRQA